MAPKKPQSIFPDPNERQPAILLVEDDILLRVAIGDYLRECGFKVYEAGNGVDAVVILRAKKVTIDLVLSDVEMAGNVDGFALAQWVRKNRPGLALILASGDRKKSAAAKTLCESEPFFARPYDLNKVVLFIRSKLTTKPQH